MTLNYTKAIADPVLGWIRLTDDEARFVDSCKYIQRLRYVHQLGFTYMVYPSARYSRFEHSLGALQVVTLMFERLMRQENVRGILMDLGKRVGLDTEDELLLHMRITALLHDLGHLPFSHVFEGVFGQGIDPLISNCSRDAHEASLGMVLKGPFKEHEVITYFILTNNDEFRKVTKEIMPHIDLRIVKALLHMDIVGKLMKIMPQYVEVIGQEDREFLKSLGEDALKPLNILKSLVSGDLDADRVEYILRDSYMSGASVGSTISIGDVERIFDNMKIMTNDGNYTIAFDEKARANLEGFVIARFNTYKLVYLHHKVVLFNTLARNLMSELLRHYEELNDEIKNYLCLLYRFSVGLLKGYDVMYIIDDYLISLLLRNREYLTNKIRGISKYLEPLVTRSTVYKALWKRDFEFIDLVSRQGINLELINDVLPYLLSKGEVRDKVLQAFYEKLREKLREASIPCLSGLINDDLTSSIIIGYRTFEPETRLHIMHGNKLVDINKLSPLAASVTEAWKRSPHIFAFIDVTRMRNCINSYDNTVFDSIKSIVIASLNESLRELGDIVNKYLEGSQVANTILT